MKYNYIRGTGIKVSKLCLGTMTFGAKLDLRGSERAVQCAITEGVNFFDTADVYTDGNSEIILGKALGDKRKEMIVASKVGFPVNPQTDFSLSRRRVMQAIDDSLRRLNTDYLDIYYLHQPDPNTPFEETAEVMSQLVKAGKIRYWGLSNYAAWQFCDAIHICERNHWVAPVITESTYNALTRGLEQELVPFLMSTNCGLTVFNPLAGGMLTGKHLPGEPTKGTRFENNANYQKRYWNDANFKAIRSLTELAEAQGATLLELALRWCINQPWVTSVILGFSSIEQLETNLRAAQFEPLTPETLAAFDEIWSTLSGGRVSYNR